MLAHGHPIAEVPAPAAAAVPGGIVRTPVAAAGRSGRVAVHTEGAAADRAAAHSLGDSSEGAESRAVEAAGDGRDLGRDAIVGADSCPGARSRWGSFAGRRAEAVDCYSRMPAQDRDRGDRRGRLAGCDHLGETVGTAAGNGGSLQEASQLEALVLARGAEGRSCRKT